MLTGSEYRINRDIMFPHETVWNTCHPRSEFMMLSLSIHGHITRNTQYWKNSSHIFFVNIYIYTQYIYIVYIFCKYEYMSIHVYKNTNKYIPLYQHSISTSASASRTASWPRAEHPGGDDRWGWKLRKRFQDPLVMSKWWSSWRFHHDITGKWCFFFFF